MALLTEFLVRRAVPDHAQRGPPRLQPPPGIRENELAYVLRRAVDDDAKR